MYCSDKILSSRVIITNRGAHRLKENSTHPHIGASLVCTESHVSTTRRVTADTPTSLALTRHALNVCNMKVTENHCHTGVIVLGPDI